VDEYEGFKVYEEAAYLATLYYRLGLGPRALLGTASLALIASSIYVLWLLVNPLYYFEGDPVSGYVNVAWYSLDSYGKLLHVPPLDSLRHLSFALILGAMLSLLNVAPLIAGLHRDRLPRIYLETTAAGYIIGGLTYALLMSFLRVLYTDIIPSVPLSSSSTTPFGTFSIHASHGWYTDTGILSLRLWPIYPIISAVLIGAGLILVYYIVREYEETVDIPPIIANYS